MITRQSYLALSILKLLCCFFMAASIAPAQQKPSPAANEQAGDEEEVLRISTELVQTDVVVVDKQGRFVEGLKAEDFEVKVDGKKQPITFFEKVKAWTASEEAQLAAARGGSSAPSSTPPAAATVERGRTIIFFVDELHLSADSISRVRKLLLRFIEKEMGSDDLVAISSPTANLGFLQQFTNNKSVLRAAVSRLTYQPYSVGDTQMPPMTEYQARAVDSGQPDVVDFFVEQKLRENPMLTRPLAEPMVKQRASMILKQSSVVTINMLGSLDNLMRTAQRVPGRKIAFFLTDGFFLDNNNSDSQNRLRRVATTAARAGVVIYTIDGSGLLTGPDMTEAEVFDPKGKHARATATAQISPFQDSLYTLAEQTGGRVYVNSNNLNAGLTAAMEEISNYYLLSWRPDPETNRGGKFRRIEVSVVGKPDLKVRARRGFLTEGAATTAKATGNKAASSPAPVKTADDELREALNDLLPRKGLPAALSVNYLDLPEKVTMLTVGMKIPGEALTYEQAADKFNAVLDVLGAVYDEKGQPLSSFKDTLKASAASTDPANLRTQKVVYTTQVPIKPGLYQVRIAARDAQGKRTGSAMEWIEVPDLSKGSLTMSSLFISELKAGQAQSDEEALKLPNMSIDRRFANTSKLLFLTYIYNAARNSTGANAPDVGIQIQILSGLKPILKTPVLNVSTEGLSDLSRIPYSAAIPLTGIPAGRYLMQITTTDRVAKTSASQRVNIEIQ
jgi:VWFA-related protein